MTENLDTIFAERAEAYRQRESHHKEGQSGDLYLHFHAAGIRCAIQLKSVKAVLPKPSLTRVPGTQAPYLGVFPWRGNILDALSFAQLLKEESMEGPLLLLEGQGCRLGLSIESVEGVHALEASAFRPMQQADWPVWLPGRTPEGIYNFATQTFLAALSSDSSARHD